LLTDAGRRAENLLAIGEPGRAATQLGPGLPTRFPDSADHELSECRLPGATVRAASVRGVLHRYRDQPRQDRFSLVFDPPTMTLIATVCDGVGQFALSQEAAGFVAADVPRAFLLHRDWHLAVAEVNERLKDFVAATVSRPHLDHVPADVRMATTLAAAAIRLDPDNRHASVAWTDDTSAWLLTEGQWRNLTPDPDASDDDSGLHSGRVKALPHANPRLRTAEHPIGGGPLFLMTDGVGVPLEGSAQVRETLAGWWATPPDVFTFAQQVGFARKGHMDDRTVVGVWFEAILP
jgi:serine/threonine protein phosphatase PrpC